MQRKLWDTHLALAEREGGSSATTALQCGGIIAAVEIELEEAVKAGVCSELGVVHAMANHAAQGEILRGRQVAVEGTAEVEDARVLLQ